MNLKYIQQEHIIERYLAQQLDVIECEKFEAACMENKAIADELESVMLMKQAIIDKVSSAPDESAIRNTHKTYKTWAIAATVLLGLGLALLASPYLNFQHNPEMAPRAIAGEYAFQIYRGSADWNLPYNLDKDVLLKTRPGAGRFQHILRDYRAI